jgi:hypothetical protein
MSLLRYFSFREPNFNSLELPPSLELVLSAFSLFIILMPSRPQAANPWNFR